MPAQTKNPPTRKAATKSAGMVVASDVEQGRPTPTSAAKRAHLVARVTDEQKTLFERAAALRNQPLSQFMIAALQREAEQVVREHDVITLSARDSRSFVQALLHAEPPSPRLHQAAERYKALMGDR